MTCQSYARTCTRPIQFRLAAGLALSLTAAAHAQVTYTWASGVSDSWHEPLAWLPGGFPNAQTDSAIIAAPGVYTVTLGLNNVVISTLDITNPTADLLISARVLDVYGGSVLNDGTITVGAPGSGGGLLRFRSTPTASLTGSGTVVLRAPATSVGSGGISSTAFDTTELTIGVGQTITGFGAILIPFHNTGTIFAGTGDDIMLSTGYNGGNPTSSTGTIEANSGGIVQLRNINIDMMGIGTVLADGGEIRFEGQSFKQRLANGTANTANGGLFRSIEGNAELEDMTLNGDMAGDVGRGFRFYGSSFTNNGTVTVTADGVNGFNALRVMETPYTFDGVGEMVMVYPGALNPNAAATLSDESGGGVLTNGTNHTIRGKGRVAIDMTNQGTITADMPGESFDFVTHDITNQATLRATNGGILKIFDDLTQTGAGHVELDGGFLDFGAASPVASITGGSIDASNGGKAVVQSGNGSIENVTLNTDTDLLGQTVLSLGGNVNNGSMLLQLDGGNYGIVQFNAPQTWGGTGEIVLDALGENVLQYAQLNRQTAGDEVVHAVTHTIRGTGIIYAAINNQGLITADVPARTLLLQTDDKKNTGTLRADGGILDISAITLDQTGGGTIEAVNGGEIRIGGNGGAEIRNGTIDATGGSCRTSTNSNTLDGITLFGQLDANAGFSARLRNTITNNGLIWVNPDATGVDYLRVSGPVTLGGSGTLRLGSPGTYVSAYLQQIDSGSLVHAANHTIEGSGRFIGFALTNHGTIDVGDDSIPGFEIGEIRLDTGASIDCQTTSVMNLQLAGTSAGEFDRIFHGGGSGDEFHCDGTLNVSHINGFDGPNAPTTIDLVTADNRTGTFSTVNLPTPAHGHYSIAYTPTAVQLVLCYADCDGNGSLNVFDYICFGTLYASTDPYADCDANGVSNVFDYICFANAYAAGCP